MIYCDTSFVVALYVDEEHTEPAHQYMDHCNSGLFFTPFHRLETRTALRLRVFRREMDLVAVRIAFRTMEADVSAGILVHSPLDWSEALREAEAIAESHLTHVGARSGDLLHVACAAILGATEFCTFDQRQAQLARRTGLKIKRW